MIVTRGIQNLDAQLWVALLSLQSLPYFSALACQLLAQSTEKENANLQDKTVLNV